MHIRHGTATNDRPRLLITGASTRAAAWSAVRAGFFPVCADRFADEDLRQVAEVHDCSELDQQLRTGHPKFVTAARLHVTDWMFAPEVLLWPENQKESSELSSYLGPFLGPIFMLPKSGRLSLAHFLGYAELPYLREQNGEFPLSAFMHGQHLLPCPLPPTDCTWIEKPVGSGGGRNVRIWDTAASESPLQEPSYFQEFCAGQPMSAIFVTDRNRSPAVELIGLTEQLIGDETAAAPSQFAYCGNIASVKLPIEGTQTVFRIGEVLADKLGQRGLFGVDFIWDGTTPWVVEVNPRYTASCELLELALGRALLRDHWQAWLPNEPLPPLPETPRSRPGVIGKLILYARTAVIAPDLSRFLKPRPPWTVPFLADIPRKGTTFSPGDPMCTVFATARTADECRRKLERRANRVRKWFRDLPNPASESS